MNVKAVAYAPVGVIETKCGTAYEVRSYLKKYVAVATFSAQVFAYPTVETGNRESSKAAIILCLARLCNQHEILSALMNLQAESYTKKGLAKAIYERLTGPIYQNGLEKPSLDLEVPLKRFLIRRNRTAL